jgi:ABC-type lipoprotein export system ATPase subunit
MNEQFLQFLETSLNQVQSHKQIAIECSVSENVIELHNKLIVYCNQIKEIVHNTELAINYVENFKNDINKACAKLPYKNNTSENFVQPNNKEQIKNNIEKQTDNLSEQLQQLQFNLDFFQKLNFFSKNIVAIGANGSGKTTLSNKLKEYLLKTGVVISAQKILIVPTFDSVSNLNKTSKELFKIQNADKSLKSTYSQDYELANITNQSAHELGILLNNILAENNSTIIMYHKTLKNGDTIENKPITTLDEVLKIWNFLIQHRVLECKDGINLTLKPTYGTDYPAYQMSDGEKVALYLIAQVLQAPQNGFIIIDEPEMYLHKTILKKLWDRLEQEREDCIFVYLTHDLDFATSRDAKKVWIKSYTTPPSKWEIENIPENELPEALLLELLGSRKPILFCESQKGKNDEKIYNCLFPEYTVSPVESCFDVINYTKAFNKIPNITTKAFGIIDSDHHSTERLNILELDNIFALSVSEIENLMLAENFLKLLAKQLMIEDNATEQIKQDMIQQFEIDIELQVSNYISAKIDYYFKGSNVQKGNTLDDVNTNFDNFTNEIKINNWYDLRKGELQKIIDDKDYLKMISVYNNKGLKTIVNRHFKISDFVERSIKFLQSSKEAQEIIRKKFPQQITNNVTN